MKILFNTLLICLLPATILAQASMQRTDLFEGGKGGYATYRIPGIIATAKGTLLAWCEARKSGGDWDDIDILMRRSTDGGKTWGNPMVLVDAEGVEENTAVTENASSIGGNTKGGTANNPVMIADEDGTVHFVYCVEYSRAYYAYSKDDGQTFSEPVEITSTFEKFRPEYNWKVIATGPGHGIQLKNSRLLIPLWMSTGEFENGHRPSVVATIYSDDYGKTWEAGDIAVHHQKPYLYPENNQPQAFADPNETMAIQLADGRVMLNSRSESPEHFRIVTIGKDGAGGWDNPVFDPELFDPVCMGSIVRFTEKPEYGKNRILFALPNTPDDPKRFGKVARAREKLTVRMSYDEGKTWEVSKLIEPGISAYSDMAVGPDKSIYLLFEREGIDGNQYRIKYLTVAKFNLEWLTDGKDQLKEK